MSLMLMLLFWIGWFCSNLSQQIPPTLFVAGPLCLAQLPLDVSFMTWVATLILLHMFNRCSGISSRIWPVISTSNIHHILRIAHWMVVVVSNLAADPRPYGFTIMAAMAMASPLPSISKANPSWSTSQNLNAWRTSSTPLAMAAAHPPAAMLPGEVRPSSYHG